MILSCSAVISGRKEVRPGESRRVDIRRAEVSTDGRRGLVQFRLMASDDM